jgi:uncharacterized membrane protein YfcA
MWKSVSHWCEEGYTEKRVQGQEGYLDVYFESAGIEVWPWLPPLVAFVISFFTSMGGVSGAFLLLPFQMSVLGYTTPSVSATNHLYNVVAVPSGVLRYVKEGRMVWPLTGVVIAGTLPGVLTGAVIRVRYLPNPSHFKLFAAAVLLYIGVRLLKDLIRKSHLSTKTAEQRFQELSRQHRQRAQARGVSMPTAKTVELKLTHLEYEFYGERYRVAAPGAFFLSLIVGLVGGIYGIGGGAIVAPFFVSVFGLPVYTVAGAALMGTFVTSVAGVALYQGMSSFYPGISVAPDWQLGILFGAGGMAGMYLGARCQKLVPAKAIKWMLAGIIVLTAARYIWAFVASLA